MDTCHNKYIEQRKIIKKFISLYNAFQIDQMLELFAQDCLFQSISNSSGIIECNSKEELRNLANQSAKIFTSRKQSVNNWIIQEDKIAVEIDYVATLACDLPNGLKTGDILKLKGVSIYEFENNKIKRLADFS